MTEAYMTTKKKKVADIKKEIGYGVGIRQCHDCGYCKTTYSIAEPTRYYCEFNGFAVKKTAVCKHWKS
jgi:hypothetical protein